MQFIVGKCKVMRPGTAGNQTPVRVRATWNTDQSMAKRARAALGEVVSKGNSCLDVSFLTKLSSTAVLAA